MRALLGCTIAVLLGSSAGAEDKKADGVKVQHEKLQGTWRFVSIELDGKVTELKAAPPGFDLVVTGDKFAFGKAEGEMVLRPSTPLGIDLRYTKDEATVVGIYKIDGDTLTMCLRRGKAELTNRPMEFATKGITDVEIRVYKLEKPMK